MQALSYKIITSFFLLVLVYSLSCTKKVEIRLPPHSSRLVVHSFTSVGDSFMVTVAQTVRTDTFTPGTYLPNAAVLLYADGVLKDTLDFAPLAGTYSSHVHAEEGKTYTLRVFVPGFQPVEATARALPAAPTESVQHNRKARHDTYRNELDDIIFSFRDPANVRNYYLVAVFTSAGSYQRPVTCVYATDPVIEQPRGSLLPFDEGNCIDGDEIFFTDKAFDGQLKEIMVSTSSMELTTPYPVPASAPLQRPYMKRYAISEDFYKYYKYTSGIKDINDLPFYYELAPEKGNITNGYGLFTVYNVVTDTLR